jgi:iron-regulated transporter 1
MKDPEPDEDCGAAAACTRAVRDALEMTPAKMLERSPSASLNDPGVRRRLLVSHGITRLGTQGWQFAAPLVLTRFTPQSILGPAVWGIVTTLATAFLGPVLGTWADRSPRDLVITYGVVLQFVAVSGATVVVFLAGSSAQGAPGPKWSALLLFTSFSIFEKLGMILSDVSVKREWIPQLFRGEQQKALNSRMSQIDLATECVGPFLAGLLIAWGELIPDRLPSFMTPADLAPADFGFVATGLVNAASFWPQLALLRSIYRSHADCLQPAPEENLSNRRGPVPPDGAWSAWFKHPCGLRFLSLSYALLYLTVLTPHGALITAFLLLRQVPSWQLSLMRGAGAVLGIAGTMGRAALARGVGDRSADNLSVWWLAAWMFAALLSFEASAVSGIADLTGHGGLLLTFMAALCFGRPGLYAFELGVLNKEQDLVDPRHRSAIGAVDAALTSLATLVMYSSGMCFSGASQFGILVKGSSFFVSCGAATYFAWTDMYRAKRHRHVDEAGHVLADQVAATVIGAVTGTHSHADSHGDTLDDQGHHHTPQMEEAREAHDDGSYWHEHIVYEPRRCAVQ